MPMAMCVTTLAANASLSHCNRVRGNHSNNIATPLYLEENEQLQGLSLEQVVQSRQKYGSNVLTPVRKQSPWRLLLEKFRDPLIIILLVALALSFGVAIYEMHWCGRSVAALLEPVGILVAVLLATIVGFAVEMNANRKFRLINRVGADVPVKVVRGGKVRSVPQTDVVVGDIVLLDTGEEVPADGTLLRSSMLIVNESTLTGELQVRKSHLSADADSDATYATNELKRGTMIIEGHCTMVVDRVGDATEYGKVNTESQIESGVKTPLMLQLERLGKLISVLGYTAAVLLLAGRTFSYFIADDSPGMLEFIEYTLTSVMLAVTLIVVSVPEGLPMSVTLSLALSMRRMLLNNNLVRRMHACETMGASTVICTDKTGTLTQNQMRVAHAHFFALHDDTRLDDSLDAAIVREAIAANTTAYLEDKGGRHVAIGNPTEGALLLWLDAAGDDYLALRRGARVEEQLPFSTERKYMATVVESACLGRRVLYVKGASEILYDYCSATAGGKMCRQSVRERLFDYQRHAMRTLGFAYKVLGDDECPIADGRLAVDGLTFMGIVAISDPVREDVPGAIGECLRAGIQVKIVTGDTPATAYEIGRQVGIVDDGTGDGCVVQGAAFAAMDDAEATAAARKMRVMSRARPADKSRLVRLLQGSGEVVAVTGDGTNDAPALKAAQVGLSMGDGTAVAKEASDITIIDNSFASITKAVLWGRSLYLNIQRFVVFQLTVNVIACVVVTLGSYLGKQAPLSVTQMLWVNLIMDTFAALAMASLPATPTVMSQHPRPVGSPIITASMWRFIAIVGGLLATALSAYLLYLKGTDSGGVFAMRNIAHFEHSIEAHELTKFFTAFVFVQFWNMFNAKAFGSGQSAFARAGESKVFFGMMAVVFVGQVLISMYGGEFFRLADIRLGEVLAIAALTSPIMIVGELYHILRK